MQRLSGHFVAYKNWTTGEVVAYKEVVAHKGLTVYMHRHEERQSVESFFSQKIANQMAKLELGTTDLKFKVVITPLGLHPFVQLHAPSSVQC